MSEEREKAAREAVGVTETEPTPADALASPEVEAARTDTEKADAARPNISSLGLVDRDGRLVGAAFPYQVGAGEGVTPVGTTVDEREDVREREDDEAVKRAQEQDAGVKTADRPADEEPARTRTLRTPGEKR